MLDERTEDLHGDHPTAGEAPVGTIWIEDLEVGLTRTLARTFDDVDIGLYARLSGDNNPVHLCDDYASGTIFGGRIAHGMLTAGLISAVIGEQLPGHGAIYLGQNLSFMAPVRPGDRVVASVSVAAIDRPRRRVTLACRCSVGNRVVLQGDALVLAPSRELV